MRINVAVAYAAGAISFWPSTDLSNAVGLRFQLGPNFLDNLSSFHVVGASYQLAGFDLNLDLYLCLSLGLGLN